jgi:hypothetical protein
MVDSDILLLAMVNMSEGVKAFIGDKGAKVVFRDAGRKSGPKLLESLIGHFPGVLDKEEALRRYETVANFRSKIYNCNSA